MATKPPNRVPVRTVCISICHPRGPCISGQSDVNSCFDSLSSTLNPPPMIYGPFVYRRPPQYHLPRPHHRPRFYHRPAACSACLHQLKYPLFPSGVIPVLFIAVTHGFRRSSGSCQFICHHAAKPLIPRSSQQVCGVVPATQSPHQLMDDDASLSLPISLVVPSLLACTFCTTINYPQPRPLYQNTSFLRKSPLQLHPLYPL